jgi:predicted ester cyclase
MTESSKKELVRRLVDEAMNARRFEVLDELCTPRLATQLRQAFEEFVLAFPDWNQELVELIAEGDRVVAHCTCSGTQHGAFVGHAATGRRMAGVHEVFIFRVQNGRLCEVWSLEDTWERMRQLGQA